MIDISEDIYISIYINIYIYDDAFRNATVYEKQLRLAQKQIKSINVTMKMEDVEKDVAPVSSNKRESFLGSYISFPWGYRGKNT